MGDGGRLEWGRGWDWVGRKMCEVVVVNVEGNNRRQSELAPP